jgi:hypothetical protein
MSKIYNNNYKLKNGKTISLTQLVSKYTSFIKTVLNEDIDTWDNYSFSQYIEDSLDGVITGLDLYENENKNRNKMKQFKESYENQFGETLYKFIIGNGTYSPDVYYAYGYSEQDALDVVIDNMEKQGRTYDFSEIEEMESNGEIYDDEYIVGGNHGVAIIHNGEFRVETPDNYKEAVKAGILKPVY